MVLRIGTPEYEKEFFTKEFLKTRIGRAIYEDYKLPVHNYETHLALNKKIEEIRFGNKGNKGKE